MDFNTPTTTQQQPADGLTIRETGYLYHKYPMQATPQPCYIELCEDGTVLAEYDGEIGGAVPASVWHERDIRISLPGALKADRADALIAELRPLLARVHAGHAVEWDGRNNVGRLTDDAADARFEIEPKIWGWVDDDDFIRVWDAGDWLQLSSAADLGSTAATTDDQLDAMARRLTDEAAHEGVDELEGLDKHLEDLRQQRIDEEE